MGINFSKFQQKLYQSCFIQIKGAPVAALNTRVAACEDETMQTGMILTPTAEKMKASQETIPSRSTRQEHGSPGAAVSAQEPFPFLPK